LVRLGFASMNTPEEVPVDVLARHLEERGFESLWVGEHSHIPVSRRTPYPVGGELPGPYRRMMDPYLGLLVAAGASTRLVLGTGVALPLERDLLAMAKTVATLDRLAGGRLELGVGVGWNVEELANHRPVAWAERYRALEEAVGALKALWSEDEPQFHGQYYDFDPVWSDPKPVQRPHPPVLCGMSGRLGTAHAVRWADGWMPMDVALGDLDAIGRKLVKFRKALSAAGRPEVPVTMVAFGDPTQPTLEAYRDLGVARVVVGPGREGWGDNSTTLDFIDRYAPLASLLAGGGG
jgi:probable F420-dependent oxidoreductase